MLCLHVTVNFRDHARVTAEHQPNDVDLRNPKGLERSNLTIAVMATGTKIRLYPILIWFTMVMTLQYN